MNTRKFLKNGLIVALAAIVIAGFSACSSDDDDDDKTVDTAPISLYAGDSTFVAGANTVVSDNEFVAWVNKDKSIEGFHVGETYVNVNGKSRIKVTVKPKYNTYDDPVTDWGCSRSVVRNRQVQGTLSSQSDNDNLIYLNVGRASTMLYTFEGGKLKSVAVAVSTTYTSEYVYYLMERYLMAPYERNNETYYVGMDALDLDDAKTAIMMQVYSASQLITVYMPASSANSSASAKADVVKQLRKLGI